MHELANSLGAKLKAMPDISKCSGEGCKVKKKCYRFTSTPSPFRQAYAAFNESIKNGKCDSFWPNNQTEIK